MLELDANRMVVFSAGTTDGLLGRGASALLSVPVMDMVTQTDLDIFDALLTGAQQHGRINNAHIHFQSLDGREVPLDMAGYCMPDMENHLFLAFRVNGSDAQEEARDPESGLHDPEGFTEIVSGALSTGGDEDRQLTVIEMPELQDLRERLNSDSDDHLQRTIGAVLKANSVDGDAAGKINDERYGLVHGPDLNVADLEKQISAFAKTADPKGEGVETKTATIQADTGSMSEADLATSVLFLMNDLRRNQGKDFTLDTLSTKLSDIVGEATQSVEAFKRMVGNNTFDMAFHPIVDITTGKPHHYEVLARFGAIGNSGSPYRDITLAEETGMIREFDLAMTKKCIDWLLENGEGGKYKVAVNLSGHTISDDSFVVELHALLDQYKWARNSLMFEITESSEIKDLTAVNAVLQGLRKKGFKVCLDDFGAGSANFQYLSTLEVDVVKLDGPALKQARSGPRGRAFIKALTTLCDELHIEVVAEMIDDLPGLTFVRQCGITFVQGYIYGKPSLDIEVFKSMKEKAGK